MRQRRGEPGLGGRVRIRKRDDWGREIVTERSESGIGTLKDKTEEEREREEEKEKTKVFVAHSLLSPQSKHIQIHTHAHTRTHIIQALRRTGKASEESLRGKKRKQGVDEPPPEVCVKVVGGAKLSHCDAAGPPCGTHRLAQYTVRIPERERERQSRVGNWGRAEARPTQLSVCIAP